MLAYQLNADVQQRYLETARSSATLIAQIGIQPLLNPEQLAGGLSPTDITIIDEKLRGATVSTQVGRIKVWNRAGTVVYSDNHGLVDRTFPIDDDLANALAGTPSASITSGQGEENSGDNLAGPLIQVYVPLVFTGTAAPSGAFELYLPYAPVQAAIDSESHRLYGFLVAGLALFYASMFPVVLLADRWRRRLLREAQSTALANLAVLERLNALKSEFLTRISHQFRTALVGIKGFSEVIRDSEQLDLDEVKAFAGDIYTDAERLDRAFNEMLELDRIETGRMALKIARVDLNQLITEIVEANRMGTPDRVLTLRLAPSSPAVSCDRSKVAQVLMILLSNATKYSPAGSEVVVTSRANAESAQVTVKDQGSGMPADFGNGLNGAHRMANGQSDSHLNRGTGVGVGLPIARQIIEMHGGRIWFDSKAGQGTEFHFNLPLNVKGSGQMKAITRNLLPADAADGQPDLTADTARAVTEGSSEKLT